MPSVTTWQRLEGLPRTDDLGVSLRAEIADPLWMLARQRQFGELRGEDAGSPIETRFAAKVAPLTRMHAGPLRRQAGARSVDIDSVTAPLEVVVERESAGPEGGDAGLAVHAGLHFLRLLRANQATSAVELYVDHYALQGTAFGEPDEPLDPVTAKVANRSIGRVPDGRRIRSDLLAALSGNALTSLPAAPAIPAAVRPRALLAAQAFLAWFDTLISRPDQSQPSAWSPSRLEHSVALQADLDGNRVVLRADEYRGGRLDWHSFVVASSPNLGEPETAAPTRTITRTVLPTPASYPGMPANRFWEIEDGHVRFGGLTTGRTDLARLLLAEYGLTYGNDWFVVPIELPVGTICSLDELTVTDTFGVVTKIGPTRSAEWNLFTMAATSSTARLRDLFFLPPTLPETSQSPPVEEVAFLRDEMANVVWAIERQVSSAVGAPVSRQEEHQQRIAMRQSVDTDFEDAQLIYRLATDVPYHWHPLVPVKAAGTGPVSGIIDLELRPLVRVLADGTTEAPEPRGEILTAASPLRLQEEEVPRSGTDVVRYYELARSSDGRYHLWSGRHRRVGQGEGSSGLRFDTVAPTPPDG